MRYFSGGWEGDYDFWEPHWDEEVNISPVLSDNIPKFTGILDSSGNPVMKSPRPIGFGRDNEW